MDNSKKPNVLLITTDQQRKDSLGCYGNKLAVTPNLDRLASEGVRFDNYYVQNPVCMPSRASFLTGRYCSSLGTGKNGAPLPEETRTVNRVFSANGYETAQIGKLHFQPHAPTDYTKPQPRYGFDTFILSEEPGCYDDDYIRWVESKDPSQVSKVRTRLPPAAEKLGRKGYSDKEGVLMTPYLFEGREEFTHSAFVAEETCRYIRKKKEKPFFAIAGFYHPHPPVNPPKRFVDMYDINKMPLPALGKDEQFIASLKNITEGQWRRIIAYYLATVSEVDDCVGKILGCLKETGLERDTVIIFTSDHGEYLGDHGREGKGDPGHDCVLRVPFIVKYPAGFRPGKTVDAMTEAVDLAPTMLDCCGITPPGFMQGMSMRGLLEGSRESFREDVLMESFNHADQSYYSCNTVKTKQYMYSCNSRGGELLYDRIKDPLEANNVTDSPEYKEALSEMRKRLACRLAAAAYKSLPRTAEY